MTATEIRDEYRRRVLAWSAPGLSPDVANSLLRDVQAFYKSIRDLPEGREALLGLLGDDNDAIRSLAATHSLSFAADRGVSVLEEMERRGGLHGFEAKWTLRQFRKGELDLDW